MLEIQYTTTPAGTSAAGRPLYRVDALGMSRTIQHLPPMTLELAVQSALSDIARAAYRLPRETRSILALEAQILAQHREQIWWFTTHAEACPTEADMVGGLEAQFGTLLTDPSATLHLYAKTLHTKGLIPAATYDDLRAFVLAVGEDFARAL